MPSQTLSPRKLVPTLTVERTMDIIRTTVPKLEELTRGVSEDALGVVTDYGWSVNDQLAHLRSCQEVLGGNMLRIVREDQPSWKATAPTVKQREYFGARFGPAFAAFRALRSEILQALEPLPHDAWEGRTAIVSAPPGKVYANSVLYYGDWMARHERGHLRHIARIVGEVA